MCYEPRMRRRLLKRLLGRLWIGWLSVLVAGVLPGCGGVSCPENRIETEDRACVCAAGLVERDGRCVPSSDSDGGMTEDGQTPGAPSTARARFPWNGFATGSIHAASTAATRKPLRPRFVWEPAAGAAEYEIQITDECSLSFEDCAFETPVVTARIQNTEYVPEENLPISTAPPVGRRYYWRIRACSAPAVCSAWTTPRYLDVGRLRNDFDGDGYSDAAIGANRQRTAPNRTEEGIVYIFAGSSTGLSTTPAVTLTNPEHQSDARFGEEVAAAGDLNADGYSDLVVGAPRYDRGAVNEGNAFVYLGSSDGLGTDPAVSLDNPSSEQTNAAFGFSITAVGDVNTDGLADIAIGANAQNMGTPMEGAVFLYFGTTDNVGGSPSIVLDNPDGEDGALFGFSVAGLGDLGGDGQTDLIVGAVKQNRGAIDEGNAFIYFLDPGKTDPTIPLDSLANQNGAFFGQAVAGAGDINGDGYADVVVGSPRHDEQNTDEGQAYVWFGTLDFIESSAWVIPHPFRQEDALFGSVVTGIGDVNGDGLDDIAIGAPGETGGATDTGNAFVFFGTTDDTLGAPTVLMKSSGQTSTEFGIEISGRNDFNGDGYADVLVAAPKFETNGMEQGVAFVYLGGAPFSAQPADTLTSPLAFIGGRFGEGL